MATSSTNLLNNERMLVDVDIRDERERSGCCPNCGTRLYSNSEGVKRHMMFKRKVPQNNATMTPLTIAGSVERGQCLRCNNARVHGTTVGMEDPFLPFNLAMPTAQALPVPVVKANPIVLEKNRAEDAVERTEQRTKPHNRKQPPEMDLLGTKQSLSDAFNIIPFSNCRNSDTNIAPIAAAAGTAWREIIASDGSDDDFDEETALPEFALCMIDSDDLASSLNELLSQNDFEDDRKPSAKPSVVSNAVTSEQRDIDMSFLESTASKQVSVFKCPSSMCPNVFFQLPLEMQKELSEHTESSSSSTSNFIDPETLSSLPEHIKKEVLQEMAAKKQTSDTTSNSEAIDRLQRFPHSKLSESIANFLTQLDLCEKDFEDLPEDVQNDIIENKRRSQHNGNDYNLDDEFTASGYDPEMLASLPQDLKEEILENERREREERRKNKSRSTVGAHSVSVPAGYYPDAFEALPEDIKQELKNDVSRHAQNRGTHVAADDDDTALMVFVQPIGPGMISCTYKGEYNMMGKRHGDGELTWINGDKYIGKFNDGYIDGRGTIYFRDGTEYAGQWKKNRFHGEGTRRFQNGNVYNGNYVDGKRQGQGKCYFANGDMYVGDWKGDTIHGFGRYYYNNGHSFEGMFRDGKRNGRGKYQLTDGRVEIYRYVNDCRKGDGVRWSSNRKKAWRMNGGKAIKRVSLEEAAQIANRCGPQIEAT